MKTGRHEDIETGRHEDIETGRHGGMEAGKFERHIRKSPVGMIVW